MIKKLKKYVYESLPAGRQGFTLIEMMVSVAIFSFVMVIALGALLAISTSDRKAESLKAVINNLNFSLDSMSRALRTGSNWGCNVTPGADCSGGANKIIFTAAPVAGVAQVTYYRLDSTNGNICNQTSPNIGCLEKSTDNVNWQPLTAPEVIITDYSPTSYLFYMVGSAPGPDTVQPKLVITLSGYVNLGGATSQGTCGTAGAQCSVFHVQTSVTQRIYDQ